MKSNEHAWTKRATKLCDTWESKYTTPQYASLAKSYGVKKKIKNITETNCNKDLAQILQRSITADIDHLIGFADKHKVHMFALFKEPLAGMEASFIASSVSATPVRPAQGGSGSAFEQVLRSLARGSQKHRTRSDHNYRRFGHRALHETGVC